MGIAVVRHDALVAKAKEVGFPLYTKVQCESGYNGFALWDLWIRKNVEWVSELGYDPELHVKLTESAQLVGELPNEWELRCQKFIEGDAEYNTFKSLQSDTENTEFYLHVNRQAMQVTVSNAMFRYQLEFETAEDGSVITHNRLGVAIFDKAEDSSISYNSDIEVAQLWTTDIRDVEDSDENPIPTLLKRAYSHDPEIEKSYPWIMVGHVTPEEIKLWEEHNRKPVATLEAGSALDARAIDESFESFKSSTTPINIASVLAKASIAIPFEDFTAKPQVEREFKTVVVDYPEVDGSGVGGDV